MCYSQRGGLTIWGLGDQWVMAMTAALFNTGGLTIYVSMMTLESLTQSMIVVSFMHSYAPFHLTTHTAHTQATHSAQQPALLPKDLRPPDWALLHFSPHHQHHRLLSLTLRKHTSISASASTHSREKDGKYL